MTTAYNVTVEYASPLRLEKTVLVAGWADVLALREAAKGGDFRVLSYTSAPVRRFDEAMNEINRAKLMAERFPPAAKTLADRTRLAPGLR